MDAISSETVNFIEADILMGGTKSGLHDVPIMAHPPDNSSDISFAEWIEIASEAETSKGLKLDFKDIESVEPCLRKLQEIKKNSDREIWLNADILIGPGSPKRPAVDRARFLALAGASPLKHTLSIGWTTGAASAGYSWRNVLEMLAVIEKIPESTAITFPVRLSKLSFYPLAVLIGSEKNYSLTVWSSLEDSPSYLELIRLYRAFPGRVFLDLPVSQQAEFERELMSVENVPCPRIAAPQADTKIRVFPYTIVSEGAGEITLKSDRPCTFRWDRIDENVRVEGHQENSGPKPLTEFRLRVEGTGRIAFYPTH
ncbi:protein FAM151B [Galendromus occidentalis]|uniref:Protein FAM151B n=1 Tax=Galendromus occidentalis TaxID=34638 RepID=A0AAJ6QUZ6_9ACAR|nr:protein FAM151B [Galendromus occidentalis]